MIEELDQEKLVREVQRERSFERTCSPYFKQGQFYVKGQKQVEVKSYQLISIADQRNSLEDIFLHFFPTIFKNSLENEFNSAYRYFITLYIFRERLNPNSYKIVQYQRNYCDQIGSGKSEKHKRQTSKVLERSFIIQILKDWQDFSKDMQEMSYAKKRKNFQKYFKDQIDLICQNSKELEFLVPPSFSTNHDYIKGYLRSNLEMLYKVEWLKPSQRKQRLINFLHVHHGYFKTFIVKSSLKKEKPFVYGSLGHFEKPISISLEDLIRMRDNTQKYQIDNRILIQEIYFLLKEYNQKVKNRKGHPLHYKHLHPKYIMYNQLTLKMKLSQYPLAIQALGLGQEPLSIEGRIVHEATPRCPAQKFLTPVEIQKRYLYRDSYYGETWWLQKDYLQIDSLQQNQHSKILEQRYNMQQENIFFKFLFTAYFIIKGTYYKQEIKNAKQYQNSIVKLKAQLQKKPSNIRKLFSIENMQLPQQFQFTFSQLKTLFSFKEKQDSLIESMYHLTLKSQYQFYHKLKNFIRQALLFSPNFYYENIKCYLINILIDILTALYLDSITYFSQCKKPGQLDIIREFPVYAKFKRNISKSIETFKEKCKIYLQRCQTDKNKQYMEKQGAKILQKVQNIILKYKKIEKTEQKLDDFKKEGLQKYIEHLQQHVATLSTQYFKISSILSAFCDENINIKRALKDQNPENKVHNQKCRSKFAKVIIAIKCFLLINHRNWLNIEYILKTFDILSEESSEAAEDDKKWAKKFKQTLEYLANLEKIKEQTLF